MNGRDRGEPGSRPSRQRLAIALLPLVFFVALAAVFLMQLLSGRDASVIPSALIGQPAPALDLPPLEGLTRNGEPVPAPARAAAGDRLTLVNIWASWCVPCRQEHPFLMRLAEDDRVRIVGVNYKDKSENALRFLGELGNPFDAVGIDSNGRTAIDWGVYGVPESYLVDKDGTIIYKKVGPLSEESYSQDLLPEIEAAWRGD